MLVAALIKLCIDFFYPMLVCQIILKRYGYNHMGVYVELGVK